MPTAADFTGPYLGTFTPVPPVASDVCNLCHGAPNPGWARCLSCTTTLRQVSRPITRVVPVTLCAEWGPVHNLLRGYKDGPEELRARFLPRVAALLARFVDEHGKCVGDWETVTAVPSSKGRPGRHPLVRAIGMVSSLASHYEELLVPGARPARHLAASDHAFEVTTRLDGRRVLLVDDTFTSGAELQSAASALKLAGASIPAAVVIGRFIRPGFNEAAHSLWQRASDREFTFERCCLCDPPWPEG